MRSIIKYIAFVSLLSLIVVSCGPSAAEKEAARVRRSKTPNPIVWDTLSVNKGEPLDAKEVKASCSIEINYIVPKEYVKQEVLDSLIRELNSAVLGDDNGYRQLSADEAMQKYADTYIENYKKEATNQLPLWKKTTENGANAYFSYDKKIETEVLYNEANLISYQVKTTETKGDSTYTIVVKNILLDLTTGSLLRQTDIFEEEFKDKLNEILISQVIKDKKVGNIKELQALGYWGIADIEANNNFYVDKDGITYTFSPDEYSDAELGVLNIFVDYNDMIGIFKAESAISILIYDLD